MTWRGALIGLVPATLLTALGLWLWSSQGVTVWLQGAMAYCF